MLSEAQRLHATLVAAFPGHVTAVFAERGYPLDRASVESIEEATAFLDVELGVELEQEYREQRRSPLEIFRAALEIVAQALRDAQVSPTASETAFAETDAYGLAPGGPAVLGPEAHEAHLVWGAAKASAILARRSTTPTKPVVLLMAADRGEQSVLAPLLESPGMDCLATRNPAAIAAAIEQRKVLFAFIDLAHRSARGAMTRLLEADIPTVVYGDDIDDLVETGLRAQGVRMVIRRRDFVADPTRFLPRLA